MSNRGSLLPIQRFSPCEKNSMSSSELLSAEQVGWLDNMTSGLPYQLEHRSRCPLEQECEACNISSEIIQSFNLLDPNEVERRSEEVDSLANQVVTATFRNTICIRIPKKMMDEMGIEIPLVMKYYSFFARRLLQIASHCSIHVDEHAQLILSEDIIIHLEPLKCSSCDGNEFNQTVNQTEELGWFRCILDEDYSRPILMTERETQWRYNKQKKLRDALTEVTRTRKTTKGNVENAPRGVFVNRICQTEELFDASLMVYIPNNMYSKKKDQRGFQKPVFFCTQNLKEIVDDDFKQALGDKLLSGLKQKGLKAKVQSELLYSSTVSKSLLPRRNPPVKTTSSKSTADYCSSADFSIYHPDYRGWHHQNYSPSMSSYESISPSDSVGSFDHIYQDNSDSSGIFEEFRYPKLFFSPEELLEKVNKRKRMS